MKLRPIVLLGLFYVAGAAALGLGVISSPGFADLTRSEVVHVPAHLVLYGGLAWMCRSAKLGSGVTAAVTLGIAVAQEATQDLVFGRLPWLPELFDLTVDGVALLMVLAWRR